MKKQTTQKKLQKEWNISEFDSMYTFYYPGFNLNLLPKLFV